MPRVEFNDLVTGADIARRLGVSRQYVAKLTERADFPKAVGDLGNYRIWLWPQVDRWNKRRRGET